ncbi:hypothetical protein KW786_01525 [Candidatus Parcubacteria bacterium]|nr:hypothetical protein [Candidatus Parcubacteria bacterium]
MNKKILFSVILTTALALPLVALAGAAPAPFLGNPFPTTLNINIFNVLGTLLYMVWVVTAAAVAILFILAGFKFLTSQGDPTKISEARRAVLWGLAGVAVIVMSFSIITLVRSFF